MVLLALVQLSDVSYATSKVRLDSTQSCYGTGYVTMTIVVFTTPTKASSRLRL